MEEPTILHYPTFVFCFFSFYSFTYFFIIFHGRPNIDSGSGGSDIPKLKEGHRDDLDHDVKMKYNSQPNTDYRENDRNN